MGGSKAGFSSHPRTGPEGWISTYVVPGELPLKDESIGCSLCEKNNFQATIFLCGKVAK